jgi:hypothetical protein
MSSVVAGIRASCRTPSPSSPSDHICSLHHLSRHTHVLPLDRPALPQRVLGWQQSCGQRPRTSHPRTIRGARGRGLPARNKQAHVAGGLARVAAGCGIERIVALRRLLIRTELTVLAGAQYV